MGFWVFVALVIAGLALRRVITLERSLRDLRGQVTTLTARIAQLGAQVRGEPRTREAALEATVAGTPDTAGTVSPDAAEPPAAVAAAAGVEAGEDAAAPPGREVTWMPAPAALESASAANREAAPADVAATAAPSPALPPLPPTPSGADSLERRIGTRWLLYLGVGALVLGLSYFVKYAFDNEWIAPPARIAIAVAAGLGLVLAGRRFVDRGLTRYGQTLTGGGVGTLYLAIYAAHHWYELIGRPVALGGMVAITLAGVWLADRQRSQVLALFAVGIGFMTPFLVDGDPGGHLALFTYDLVLVAGTLWLARRRDWPALNILSFMATLLTISTWGERHYHRGLYVSVELFLTAFAVLFLYVLRENRRSASPIAVLGTVLLASSPLIYHLASLAVLGPHRGPLLVYFIAVSVAGVIAAQHLRAPWLRVAVWLAVALPVLGFASTRLARGWQVAAWVALAAIYGLHVIAQAQALDDDRPVLRAPEIVLLHANGLWALMALWLLLSPRAIDRLPPVAFGMAGLYLVMAAAARHWHREAALHAVALAAALGAAAVAIRFSGPWAALALAFEGAALVWLGLRQGRDWLRHVGAAFSSLAVIALVVLLARPLSLGSWPFLNQRALSAAAVVALLYAAAWVSRRLAQPPGSLWFTVGRLVIVANLLTILLVSAEVSAYFGWSAWGSESTRGAAALTSAALARQLSLSIVWAAYAVGLVAIGLRIGYRPIRILAIALFALTIGKVFLVDLAELDRVYRMLSVIGLGVLLLTASYLYQRLRTEDGAAPAPLPEEPGA